MQIKSVTDIPADVIHKKILEGGLTVVSRCSNANDGNRVCITVSLTAIFGLLYWFQLSLEKAWLTLIVMHSSVKYLDAIWPKQ